MRLGTYLPLKRRADFTATQVGLSYIAPTLGVLPGYVDVLGAGNRTPLLIITHSAIYGGWLSDWHSMKLAKKANGIYEPEMRLQLLVIPSVLTPIALVMMGLGPFYNAHYMVFVLGTGLINVAGPLATIIILNYAFDCYHGMAPTDANKKAQLINHKSAPYIVASMIIAMSMAFGYVSDIVNHAGKVC